MHSVMPIIEESTIKVVKKDLPDKIKVAVVTIHLTFSLEEDMDIVSNNKNKPVPI